MTPEDLAAILTRYGEAWLRVVGTPAEHSFRDIPRLVEQVEAMQKDLGSTRQGVYVAAEVDRLRKENEQLRRELQDHLELIRYKRAAEAALAASQEKASSYEQQLVDISQVFGKDARGFGSIAKMVEQEVAAEREKVAQVRSLLARIVNEAWVSQPQGHAVIRSDTYQAVLKEATGG